MIAKRVGRFHLSATVASLLASAAVAALALLDGSEPLVRAEAVRSGSRRAAGSLRASAPSPAVHPGSPRAPAPASPAEPPRRSHLAPRRLERPDAWRLECRSQALIADVEAGQVEVMGLEGAAWRWRWALRGVGRDGAGPAACRPEVVERDGLLELRRGPLVEWYAAKAGGIEQGFDLAARPPGSGPLVVQADLTLEGLHAAAADERSIVFATGSRPALRYDSLAAYDAEGTALPATMAWAPLPAGGVLSLIVRDDGAVYPIRIDPLLSTPAWAAEPDQANAWFGEVVASAGDVNGDGFTDVLVGAPQLGLLGEVHLFLGSAAGPGATPAWKLEGSALGARVGTALAGAGDVDGDGFSDVIIGVPLWDGGQVSEGRAILYRGGASGLAAAPAWSVESDQPYALLGSSVASAGDIDGDGHSDVVIGAPYFSNGESGEGRALLFRGSAAGLSSTPAWTAESDLADAHHGTAVAGASDVNGDGFDDVIVGAVGLLAGTLSQGRASVYLGSAAGLAASPVWSIDGPHANASLGTAVAGAGDVDGDGFADIVVGAPNVGVTAAEEGRAYLYCGSATGVAPGPAWTFSGGEGLAHLGCSVASAGDVNGDGFADVVIGARHFGPVNDGRVLLFEGSGAGLRAAPASTLDGGVTGANLGASVAGAGDVDGDGFGDVVVGASRLSNGQANEGRALLLRGAGQGVTAAAVRSLEGDAYGANLGYAVSAAGDTNADGYDDVLVTIPGYDSAGPTNRWFAVYLGSATGLDASRRVLVNTTARCVYAAGVGDVNRDGFADVMVDGNLHLGSPSGPSTWVDWSAFQVNSWGAGAAGDVNGDGFADVAVGELTMKVYHGSASGPGATASWTQSGPLSTAVGHADINADGYSDLIVGASGYDSPGLSNDGWAAVYLGSAAGLSTTPAWIATGGRNNAAFGASVAGAGDVDGDGYEDVLVGAPGFSNGSVGEGRAFLYRGGPGGLATVPAWTAESDYSGAQFGFTVAGAGDVDGDGRADVIVGSPRYGNGETWEGRAWLYRGTPTGLTAAPAWTTEPDVAYSEGASSVAGAGDVDGDGYGDVIVGSYRYKATSPLDRCGLAQVFHGNGDLALDRRPRQRRTDDQGAVVRGVATDRTTSITVRTLARSHVGRARARLVVEAAALGTTFGAGSVTRTAWFDTTATGLDAAAALTGLLPGTVHRWRARVEAFPDRRGPWVSVGTIGLEGDFRTPPVGPPTPGVVRDGGGVDVDFQGSLTSMQANWNGFEDPVNGVAGYAWAIGTTPGGTDVQPFVPVGLARSAAASGLALATTTYYVTVRATNGLGATFDATSDGVLVDVTPPVAGTVNDGAPSVDIDLHGFGNFLDAHWSGFGDPESGPVTYEWAIGTTPGATDFRGFVATSSTQVTTGNTSLAHMATYYVTVRATNRAGLTVTVTSDGVTVDTTPPLGGQVRDGAGPGDIAAQTSLTMITAHWLGFTDADTGATFEWAIGTSAGASNVRGFVAVGTATSVSDSSLTLTPGTRYYVALRSTNGAGRVTTGNSNGVIVDTSPPVAGAVRDGAGADVDAQASQTTIQANWLGFSDAQSGISGYEWAIGSTPGGAELQAYTSVGLASTATRTGLALAVGSTYWVTVRATNGVGQTVTGTSDGVSISDTTPPASGVVSDGVGADVDLQASGTDLAASWTGFTDPETGVAGYEWAIGSAPGATDVRAFTSTGAGTSASASGLSLVSGATYHVTVRATNGAGLTATATSDGVRVDTSPPSAGQVTDGVGADIDLQTSASDLTARWTGFADVESAITGYEWAIGTAAGASDVRPFAPVGLATSASAAGLSLASGTTCYVTVRATNGVGRATSVSSDGVRIETTPPLLGQVLDGPTGVDVDVQQETGTIAATWTGFADPESGITGYAWAAGTGPGFSDLVPFTSLGGATSVRADGLQLAEGRTYYVTVRATNGVGFTSQSSSDGVMVVVPPRPGVVIDGDAAEDQDEQTHPTKIEASWSGFGGTITGYEWAVGTAPGRDDVFRFESVGSSTRAARAGLPLTQGARYFVTVRALGPGALSASSSSDGILVVAPATGKKRDSKTAADRALEVALAPTPPSALGCALRRGDDTARAPGALAVVGLLLALIRRRR